MRQICMSGSMSGVWKRSHGRTSEAPPDERGGNSYARPTATAPHSDSTQNRGRDAHCWTPPARIRTSPIRASGSYLGCLTAKQRAVRGSAWVTRVPALGPVRALLVRVSLGPCPWLHRLRNRQPSFVRRLQANWDFLSDFQQRGTLALDALRAQAAQSPWGVASNGRILDEPRLRAMEEKYLPD